MIAERLQKLGARERQALMIAGLVLLLPALGFLVVSPVIDTAARLDGQMTLEKELIKYNRSVAMQDALVSEEYAEVAGVLQKGVAPAQAIDALKAAIDDLATGTGLMISSIEQREHQRTPIFDTHYVEIGGFEANVSDLVDFLHQLRALPGLPRVTHLALENVEDAKRVRGSMRITKVILRAETS